MSYKLYRNTCIFVIISTLLLTFYFYDYIVDFNSNSVERKPLSNGELQQLVLLTEQDRINFNDTLRQILVPRVPGTPSHERVRQSIENYLTELGWHVENDQFQWPTPFGQKLFTNIIATLNPNACKRLVLACHYDSKYFENVDFLAATDSAVPCTMMLELVRVLDNKLKQHKSLNNQVTLQLIFFDGEEAFVEWNQQDSIYGSRHLASKWSSQKVSGGSCAGQHVNNELERIQVFVLLDLIGESSTQFCSHFSATRNLFDDLVKTESKLNRLKLMETKRISGTNYFRKWCLNSFRVEDDHVPFESRKVPVLHLISTPFPHNWHKPSDDGTNLHYPTINNLIKVFRVFLVEYFKL